MARKYDAYTAYLNMFGNTVPVLTQDNFSNKQLQQLKQAVYNKQYEVRNAPDTGYYQKMYAYNSRPNLPKGNIMSDKDNAINYGNYDDTSDMQNIVGRFYFNTNPNGDIVINDRYDFNKYDNANKYDPRYLAIQYGRAHGTPYDIKINLGNPNTWGNMKYTGNRDLGLRGQ